MNKFAYVPHPHLAPRRRNRPPKVADEYVGFNGRLAAEMTRRISSMWSVYLTCAFVIGWILLASWTWGPLHHSDPYPFPFLLFLGNLVQLLLVFVILVGQGVLGKAADTRAEQTYLDAEAILHDVSQIHRHLQRQDKILNHGIALVESTPHPWMDKRKAITPARVEDQYVGLNGRIAAWLTRGASTMWAFYLATVFQFGWIALAQIGVISFDPYPFAFLLFLSSLLQLIFMFVIMVGQDVLGRAGDTRAHQTFLDAEAVLEECRRLQHHLTAQDKAIVKICGYIADHAPENHPVKKAETTLVVTPEPSSA